MAQRRHDSQDQVDGFTLTEVLVALVLVSVLMGGVAGLFTVAMTSTRAARDETAATLLAVQTVETFRSALWHGPGLEAPWDPSGPGGVDGQELVTATGEPSDVAARSVLFSRRRRIESRSDEAGGWVLLHVGVSAYGRAAGAGDGASWFRAAQASFVSLRTGW